MKIAVCFKLIEDYDQVPQTSWRASSLLPATKGLTDTQYVKKTFGFFDEGALETALRVKDSDCAVELEAISLGKEDRIFTEALYAAGYDKVTYLDANSDFDSKNTASGLCKYIKEQGFDLVLTGEAVGPLDSGSVPYLMANYLSCPIISKVSEVKIADGKLLVTSETKDSIDTFVITSGTPHIAIVSNAKYPYLRFATYAKKEEAKKIPANILSAKASTVRSRFSFPESKTRNVKYIAKESLKELLEKQIGGNA